MDSRAELAGALPQIPRLQPGFGHRWRFSFPCLQLSIHPPAGSTSPAPLTDGHFHPMNRQHTKKSAKPTDVHLGVGMASPVAPRAEQGQGQCGCPGLTEGSSEKAPWWGSPQFGFGDGASLVTIWVFLAHPPLRDLEFGCAGGEHGAVGAHCLLQPSLAELSTFPCFSPRLFKIRPNSPFPMSIPAFPLKLLIISAL